MNLLEETLDILQENGKTQHDVLWVMDKAHFTTWINFEESARNYNYDNGYGGAEVNEDLKIVGKDWWLERHEYDGSEWWEFKQRPQLDIQTLVSKIDLRCLFDQRWDNDNEFLPDNN